MTISEQRIVSLVSLSQSCPAYHLLIDGCPDPFLSCSP